MTSNDLANKIDELVGLIDRNPSPIIGKKVVVNATGGSGPVIGSKVTVTVGPGQTGPVIGEFISVTAGGPNQQDLAVKGVLKSLAAELRSGGNNPSITERIRQSLGTVADYCQPIVSSFAQGLGQSIGASSTT